MLMKYIRRALPISVVIVGITLALVLFRTAIHGIPKEHLYGQAFAIAGIVLAEIAVLTPVLAVGLWFYDLIDRTRTSR